MSSYLVTNVRVFDGLDVLPQPCNVYIDEGKIQHVDRAESQESRASFDAAVKIDGRDCTLLPGLIDAHVHVFRGVDEAKRCLSFGVTTVLDMHNTPDNATYMIELSQRSSDMPDVLSAFFAATIDGGWPRAIVQHTTDNPTILQSLKDYPKLSTPESAAAYVAKNKAIGASFIKLMQESGDCLTLSPLPSPTKALQTAVIDAAHSRGMKTVAHATNMRETLLVLDAGVDGMGHQFFDRPHTSEVIAAYRKHGAFVIPTLTAISSMMGLETSARWTDKVGTAVTERLNRESCKLLCCCMEIARPGCNVQYAYDCIKALKASGIDIVCGTDSGPIIHGTALGAAVHLELFLYVSRCDFSPTEALSSATAVTARRFGLLDRGRAQAGLRADLVLVRGNPTKEIGDAINVIKVWKEGILVKDLSGH